MTLAMAGKRVLLIDLDLRRHALSSQLGHSNSKTGITSYLAGTVSDVESMIQNSGFHQNLDVIYAGVQPPNPAEMLLSDKLDKLIAEMRGRYDYVFLDSTPAMSVADAIITDRLADLCIYIVREGVLDRRQLPDINSRNAVVRSYAERNAVNAPLQGSAADIIKIAMVNIYREIGHRGLRSRMIMQVHDELIFNIVPEELAEMQTIVAGEMENAWHGDVPLEVSMGTATNWLEAH